MFRTHVTPEPPISGAAPIASILEQFQLVFLGLSLIYFQTIIKCHNSF
jgi:hypothetical protein